MGQHPLSRRRIALGVGGGIAAYKACELVRELIRRGALVRVALTPSAAQFVTPLTFQALSGHPVQVDVLDAAQEASFGHIELARWAELFVVAPATADLLAKIRAGMGSDAVTTSLLAYRGPVLLAPAMNTAMFENESTQENLAALSARERFKVVGPAPGQLACGEVGPGRLSEPAEILAAIEEQVLSGPLRGKRVLISAGPTREALDPVRFLSNPSTGKMGQAMAEAARSLGAQVTVVLGPVASFDKEPFEVVEVVTAEEMAQAVLSRIDEADYFVSAAAVSDYRPAVKAEQKIKKGEGNEALTLVRTPDILLAASQRVSGRASRPTLVGFAAETERVVEQAEEKLRRKGLDWVVANRVGEAGSGFAADDNRVVLLSKDGVHVELAGPKRQVADQIWARLVSSASSGSSMRP